MYKQIKSCKVCEQTYKTWGWYKYRYFIMGLNLKDYIFETSRYQYKSTYMITMATAHQKSTIDTQKLEKKEHKHTIKENNQTTRKKMNRTKQHIRTTKTTRKQVTKYQ